MSRAYRVPFSELISRGAFSTPVDRDEMYCPSCGEDGVFVEQSWQSTYQEFYTGASLVEWLDHETVDDEIVEDITCGNCGALVWSAEVDLTKLDLKCMQDDE